jgi:hypothetical protein
MKRPDVGDAGISPALIDRAWTSPAAVAIAPFQDLLNLGSEARMKEELHTPAFGWLRDLTTASKRTTQSMPVPLAEGHGQSFHPYSEVR